MALATLLVATPALAASPHGGYSASSTNCAACHRSHQASSARSLFAAPDETGICYAASCHATGSAVDVQTAFAGGSGHRVEQLTSGGDLTNTCSSCHKAHLAAATNPGLPRPEINGATVNRAAQPNSWCGACHNDTHDWQGAAKTAYPALLTVPSRDATGYPVLGTFPSTTAYAGSAHAGIPAGTAAGNTRLQGDCLWCHASHRGPNGYDGLLDTYRPTTAATLAIDQTSGAYAASCFACHDGSTAAADIKREVTAASSGAGHRVRTSGGTLPQGAPLPCYECHNPHGSAAGNTAMISDALGASLNPRGTSAQVRQFCFSCHVTSDTGKGWDGTLGYTVVDGAETVVGLARSTVLRLPDVNGHRENSSANCGNCHGSVHNPGMGVSDGGVACYGCHQTYESPMELSGGAAALSFHHVLGTENPTAEFPAAGDSVFTEITADAFPAYPSAGDPADTRVYCLSCHVDHDKFNRNQAVNLRGSMQSGAQSASNTDFEPTGGGVCLGCHSIVRTKSTAGRLNNGTSVTSAVSKDSFASSAHNYTVASGAFGDATRFQANCVKCHNDGNAEYQAQPSFALHYSASQRILAALGRATDPATFTEEGFCYRCHSRASEGFKSVADTDWYGSAAGMSAASQAVYGQFQSPYSHALALSNSAHKPSFADEVTGNRLSAGQHVECADCHSAHVAGSAAVSGTRRTAESVTNTINQGSPIGGVWGVEPAAAPMWTEPGANGYSIQAAATKEYQICLKCHSTFRSADWAVATVAGWTNQALEFNPNNASYHPVMAPTGTHALPVGVMKAPWTNVGQQTMYCSDCHMSVDEAAATGPHGSAYEHLLRGYWRPQEHQLGVETGTSDLLCNKCHNWVNSYPHDEPAHTTVDPLRCSDCHVAIPHGGKVPRLLATRSAPTPYNAGAVLLEFEYPLLHQDQSCLTDGCHAVRSGQGPTPYRW